jgi:hypothetical protein
VGRLEKETMAIRRFRFTLIGAVLGVVWASSLRAFKPPTVSRRSDSVTAVVRTALIAGCLAWLSIPLRILDLGPALAPPRAVLPIPEPSAHRWEG